MGKTTKKKKAKAKTPEIEIEEAVVDPIYDEEIADDEEEIDDGFLRDQDADDLDDFDDFEDESDIEGDLNDPGHTALPPPPVLGRGITSRPDFYSGDKVKTHGRPVTSPLVTQAARNPSISQLRVQKYVNGIPEGLGLINAQATEDDLVRRFFLAMPQIGEGKAVFRLRPVLNTGQEGDFEFDTTISEHHVLVQQLRGEAERDKADQQQQQLIIGGGGGMDAETIVALQESMERTVEFERERFEIAEEELRKSKEHLHEQVLAFERGKTADAELRGTSNEKLTERMLQESKEASERLLKLQELASTREKEAELRRAEAERSFLEAQQRLEATRAQEERHRMIAVAEDDRKRLLADRDAERLRMEDERKRAEMEWEQRLKLMSAERREEEIRRRAQDDSRREEDTRRETQRREDEGRRDATKREEDRLWLERMQEARRLEEERLAARREEEVRLDQRRRDEAAAEEKRRSDSREADREAENRREERLLGERKLLMEKEASSARESFELRLEAMKAEREGAETRRREEAIAEEKRWEHRRIEEERRREERVREEDRRREENQKAEDRRTEERKSEDRRREDENRRDDERRREESRRRDEDTKSARAVEERRFLLQLEEAKHTRELETRRFEIAASKPTDLGALGGMAQLLGMEGGLPALLKTVYAPPPADGAMDKIVAIAPALAKAAGGFVAGLQQGQAPKALTKKQEFIAAPAAPAAAVPGPVPATVDPKDLKPPHRAAPTPPPKVETTPAPQLNQESASKVAIQLCAQAKLPVEDYKVGKAAIEALVAQLLEVEEATWIETLLDYFLHNENAKALSKYIDTVSLEVAMISSGVPFSRAQEIIEKALQDKTIKEFAGEGMTTFSWRLKDLVKA